MWIYVVLILVIVAIDQLSKWLVVLYVKPIDTVPLIQNIFHLTYSENTGAAFSILQGKQTFLVLVTAIAMTVMFVYLMKWSTQQGDIFAKIAFAMLIGGGIGNLIDRIRLGYVVDFFDARFINFAVFNMADSFVVVGVGLYLITQIFVKKPV